MSLNLLNLGFFIENEDNSSRWLVFKYERLSDFCFNCGKLGHVVPSCSGKVDPSHGARNPWQAFGPWMRASGSRNAPQSTPSTSQVVDVHQICLTSGEDPTRDTSTVVLPAQENLKSSSPPSESSSPLVVDVPLLTPANTSQCFFPIVNSAKFVKSPPT